MSTSVVCPEFDYGEGDLRLFYHLSYTENKDTPYCQNLGGTWYALAPLQILNPQITPLKFENRLSAYSFF